MKVIWKSRAELEKEQIVAEEERIEAGKGSSPEPKIEPHYQALAKQLVDSLFDLGLLSESLSRDGISGIEGLVALYFQQIAESSARCAGFIKRYKVLRGGVKGEPGHERHEEEVRWIARAREAEGRLLEMEAAGQNIITQDITPWLNDVVKFLRDTLNPPWCVDAGFAAHLFSKAQELGIFKSDCRPGGVISTSPPQGGMPGGPLLCNDINRIPGPVADF
jgi:hypothetical protein